MSDHLPGGVEADDPLCGEVETKVCPRCKEEKPLTTEFWYGDKCAKDGVQSRCRECSANEKLDRKYADQPGRADAIRALVLEQGVTRYAAAMLLTARDSTPKGSEYGKLTTISDAELRPRGKQNAAYVKVSCACGSAPFWILVSSLTSSRPTKSCGCYREDVIRGQKGRNHPNYKGALNPRTPSRFGEFYDLVELQGRLCAFCDNPLGCAPIAVDHAHDRCDHKQRRCCGMCIRGVVHRSCNIKIIMYYDFVRADSPEAFPFFREEVRIYLDSRIDLATGESVPWRTPLQLVA